MKKLLAVLVLTGIFGAVNAFAADANKDITATFESVKTSLSERKDFNASYALQDVARLMDSYMALRGSYSASLSKPAAKRTAEDNAKIAELAATAKEVSKPIAAGWLKDGAKITIGQLITNHACEIWYTETEKFEAFAEALSTDAKLVK